MHAPDSALPLSSDIADASEVRQKEKGLLSQPRPFPLKGSNTFISPVGRGDKDLPTPLMGHQNNPRNSAGETPVRLRAHPFGKSYPRNRGGTTSSTPSRMGRRPLSRPPSGDASPFDTSMLHCAHVAVNSEKIVTN
jgi:hypothetical protein